MQEGPKTFAQLVGDEKLQELRAAAAPSGKKTLWMARYCDDDQMAELYYRLFERHDDILDLAKIARDVWNIQPHWEIKSLAAGLKTWRRRLSTELDSYIDKQKTPTDKSKAMALKKKQRVLSSNLDALGRLGYAIELQTERMVMAHDIELRAKTPMKFMDQIMGGLNDMIQNYVTLAMKTGAINTAPSEVNINLKAKSDFVLQHYVANDGQKMIKAADKLLTALKDKCVKLELDPATGQYYSPDLADPIQAEDCSPIVEILEEN